MSTSSTFTSSKATSTIHPSILQPTTLSTATRLVIPTSTSSKQIGNGIFSTNPTLSSAEVVESSFTLPTEPTSQADREHVIILVMISVIVFVLFVFTIFYLFRRSRQSCNKRQVEIEEGRIEVAAARAMWAVDDILKEGSYSHKSFQLLSPSMPQPPPPVAGGVAAHPLYHPGMKRSKTLPSTRTNPYLPSRPAISYPNVVNGQKNTLEYPPSPFSMRSASKPMSPLTTMQTRRPQTPEPLHFAAPFRRVESPEPIFGRSIRSFWSLSESASIAPSSPSCYSGSPTINRSQNFLRPAPTTPWSSPPIIYSPFRSPSPPPVPHESGESSTYPMFALDRDDSPTLQASALPRFRLTGNCPSMPVEPFPIPPSPPPTSPRHPPRSSTPPLPRSPKSPRAPKSPAPKSDSPDCPSGAPSNLHRSPLDENIERWLDGSTGTVSAFGSLLAEDYPGNPSEMGSSPLAQTLNDESSQEESEEEKEKEREPAPRRVSPIRAMRSSALRKSSIGSAL